MNIHVFQNLSLDFWEGPPIVGKSFPRSGATESQKQEAVFAKSVSLKTVLATKRVQTRDLGLILWGSGALGREVIFRAIPASPGPKN